MRTLMKLSLVGAIMISAVPAIAQQKPDLFPKYQIREQTLDERLRSYSNPPRPTDQISDYQG